MQLDFNLIPNAYWKAWVGVNTAQAGLDGARAALSDLYAMRDNPQELNAQADAAEAQYRAAQAAVGMAQAQVDALRAGATEEEIAVTEAQVEQAQAGLDSLVILRAKQTIFAPVGGLVLEQSIHEGELAAPGATLLTLGDLGEVTLTVYVPEDRLGQVYIGQRVEVRVDRGGDCPGSRVYPAQRSDPGGTREHGVRCGCIYSQFRSRAQARPARRRGDHYRGALACAVA
jgi:multidrug resistance efflux pump